MMAVCVSRQLASAQMARRIAFCLSAASARRIEQALHIATNVLLYTAIMILISYVT